MQELLLRISAYANRPLEPGKTLIFFDDVEEYADILTLSESDNVLYAPIYMTMFLYYQNPQGPMVYKPELP